MSTRGHGMGYSRATGLGYATHRPGQRDSGDGRRKGAGETRDGGQGIWRLGLDRIIVDRFLACLRNGERLWDSLVSTFDLPRIDSI